MEIFQLHVPMLIKIRGIILLILLCAWSLVSRAQRNDMVLQTKENQLLIQEVQITDTLLFKQIQKFVAAQIRQDTLFRKRGYVNLYISSNNYKRIPTLQSYYITKQYANFDNLDNDRQFPLFYSRLSEKIIVIHVAAMEQVMKAEFNTASKIAFQKAIEPFLFPAKTIDWPGEKGKIEKQQISAQVKYLCYMGQV